MSLIHDPTVHRLGKAEKKFDPRNFQFAKYLDMTGLPPIPKAKLWGVHVTDWGMMKNDTVGDCTIAALGHAILLDTTMHGRPARLTDDQIIAEYVKITGQEGAAYDPATGANDNGCMILDVMNDWRKNGVDGHVLGAYAEITPNRIDLMRVSIALLGCSNVGIQLPISAQSQLVWDVVDPTLQGDSAPGSWGGHDVIQVGYDSASKLFTCITWGQQKLMTEAFWLAYGDEAYAPLSNDWISPTSGTYPGPSGIDYALLKADLGAL